jgi:hypothetical protein
MTTHPVPQAQAAHLFLEKATLFAADRRSRVRRNCREQFRLMD